MVGHVKVIGILMIVHGSLTSLLGVYCIAVGPAMLAMFHFAPPNKPPDPGDEMMLKVLPIGYAIAGVFVLIIAALNVIAGIRCFKFRGRTFAMVTLFADVITICTVYCAPIALTVMIYGLIVLFNNDVARAFQMAEDGYTPEQIYAHFSERIGPRAQPD